MLKSIVPGLLLAVSGMSAAMAVEPSPADPALTEPVATKPAVSEPVTTESTAARPSAGTTNSAGTLLGFEFGASYNLFNDKRFDGSGINFAIMYYVSDRLKAGIYHEFGRIEGSEDGDDASCDANILEFRVGLDLWASENGEQDLGLTLGFGSAGYSGDIVDSDIIADVVASYSPVRSQRGSAFGELSVNATYRYAPVSNVDAGLTETVHDLGGFLIGLSAGLSF